VYAREIGGKVITLGVSGSLWKDALIMFDRQTGSLWTQVTGESLRGPLAGERLMPIPSVMTTWSLWKRDHPDSLVLVRGDDEVRPKVYLDYHKDPEELGIFGTKNRDSRLGGKRPILGVAPGVLGSDVAVAYVLERFTVLNDALAGTPVVVASDPARSGGRLFRRTAAGRILTFEAPDDHPEAAVDLESGSRWNLLDGVAVAGPMQGTRLEAIPATPAYWFAWTAFHPSSDLRPAAR
jgi:hypothetical protein